MKFKFWPWKKREEGAGKSWPCPFTFAMDNCGHYYYMDCSCKYFYLCDCTIFDVIFKLEELNIPFSHLDRKCINQIDGGKYHPMNNKPSPYMPIMTEEQKQQLKDGVWNEEAWSIDKQRKETEMSKKKMSRDEAGKAANDWANASHAGLGVVHDEERNQYSVGFQGMHSLAEFPYAPEPEPIKKGVLCVATDMHGGVIIGRASGKKSQLGGIVIELFADAPGAPPLEKVRPVTLADLIAWGWEGPGTYKPTDEDGCTGCASYTFGQSKEPCKSCVGTRPSNYQEGD